MWWEFYSCRESGLWRFTIQWHFLICNCFNWRWALFKFLKHKLPAGLFSIKTNCWGEGGWCVLLLCALTEALSDGTCIVKNAPSCLLPPCAHYVEASFMSLTDSLWNVCWTWMWTLNMMRCMAQTSLCLNFEDWITKFPVEYARGSW